MNSFHSFPFFRSIWKVSVPSKVQVLSGLWVFGKMRISYVMCYKDASHTYTPFPQTSTFMNLFEDLGYVMFSVQVFFTLVPWHKVLKELSTHWIQPHSVMFLSNLTSFICKRGKIIWGSYAKGVKSYGVHMQKG